MALRDCIAEIKRAAGRDLSDKELEELADEFSKRLRTRKTLEKGRALDEETLAAADDYAVEMVAAAQIEKRNAAINLKRSLEAIDFVKTQFGDDPVSGLQSLLVGTNRPGVGSRYSAAATQTAFLEKYLSGMQSDLDIAGLWKVFQSGALDRDISRAMWAINRKVETPTNVSREVKQIAEIIVKHQEVARQDFNKRGGWIKRLEGWVTTQSHDQYKVRGDTRFKTGGQEADFVAWRDYILPRLDVERTFDGADPEAFLRSTWKGLASGVHLTVKAQPGLTGSRNIARAGSAQRVLHFKDADAWFDYNTKFGVGNLRESILRGFTANARATGLMLKMGTNPEHMLNRLVDNLIRDTDDVVMKQKLAEAKEGVLGDFLKSVDGTTQTPVHALSAKWAGDLRALQRMAKLGMSLISQAGDVPFYGTEMRYQGRPMLSGLGESMTNVFNRMPTEKSARQLMGMIGVYSRGRMGDIHSRFSLEDDMIAGAMTRAQQRFFKWNLMNWWTDAQRQGSLTAMSWLLADNARQTWGGVNKDFRRVMGLFGIQEGEWNIIRQSRTRDFDGDKLLAPEDVAAVDRSHYAALLESQGVKVTERRIADLREEMAMKVRTYLSDRTSFAVIEPSAREAAFMQRGTRPGTVFGEFARFIGELKAFPVTAVSKAMGREVYGRGSNTLAEAIRNGNGEMTGLAHLSLWGTAYGYMAMSAKDLIRGKNVRDPLNPRTFAAAFVQGGGAGIYGDFLFGEARKTYGGNFTSKALGPTFGLLNDATDLFGRMVIGDDLASATFRSVLANTPYANLFYTRAAFDYLILRDLQEWVNPGSLKRMEDRSRREWGQTYWLRPSEARSRLLVN